MTATIEPGAAPIHLICGSTGAGKTTYALKLERALAGVRFSIDEWMHALFWPDSPQPPQFAWSMARVERCNARILAVATAVAGRGVPCLLDLGFTTRAARARFADAAQAAGLAVRLHWVDVPADERWRRVEQRNAGTGETRQLDFAITRPMFDMIETLWEPPSPGEMAACDGIRVAG